MSKARRHPDTEYTLFTAKNLRKTLLPDCASSPVDRKDSGTLNYLFR